MINVAPIPEGFHTITPHMIIKNAAEAIDFYKKAFGAQELGRHMMPDGQLVMHASLKIGDSMLMLVLAALVVISVVAGEPIGISPIRAYWEQRTVNEDPSWVAA